MFAELGYRDFRLRHAVADGVHRIRGIGQPRLLHHDAGPAMRSCVRSSSETRRVKRLPPDSQVVVQDGVSLGNANKGNGHLKPLP